MNFPFYAKRTIVYDVKKRNLRKIKMLTVHLSHRFLFSAHLIYFIKTNIFSQRKKSQHIKYINGKKERIQADSGLFSEKTLKTTRKK